ncbi:hypothetical protein GCM10029992_32090 [Glycomyces albus]
MLVDGGYLARRDGEELTDTYVFLRTVEHRLQLQRLLRTHRVPDGGEPLHHLARVLGYTTVEAFMTAWRGHATTARRLHEKLLYKPLLDAVTQLPTHELRLSESEAADRLAVLGFADPDAALTHIRRLTAGVSRTATVQRALLPVVLHELADSPEPDRGLLAYRQVSDKLGSTPGTCGSCATGDRRPSAWRACWAPPGTSAACCCTSRSRCGSSPTTPTSNPAAATTWPSGCGRPPSGTPTRRRRSRPCAPSAAAS